MKANVPQASAEAGWSLHPQLAADCFAVGDLPLSRVLLMNDANFPWLILVPRRRDISEILDLSQADRTQIFEEIAQTAETLKAHTRCDKLNIAALGNVVPQLHIHIVARFQKDAAWPKPIWGAAPAQKYATGMHDGLAASLRRGLQMAQVQD